MKATFCFRPVVFAARIAGQDLRALEPSLHPAPEQMLLSSYLQQIAAQQLEQRRVQVEAIRSKEAGPSS